ncbi:MAG: hypothetical protein ACRCZU_00505, partial [Selenomonadaceae bacterium]
QRPKVLGWKRPGRIGNCRLVKHLPCAGAFFVCKNIFYGIKYDRQRCIVVDFIDGMDWVKHYSTEDFRYRYLYFYVICFKINSAWGHSIAGLFYGVSEFKG